MMGTVFQITVADVPDHRAEPAVRAALNEIARLEDLLSEWLPDSEISRINAAAGQRPVVVGADTFAVVKAGVDVSRWSDGAFDLSWAALRGLYDFKSESRRIPTRAELATRLPLVSYTDIELGESRRTVRLKREGMAIGTGGIGKGYALDRAAAVLSRAGIENFMIFGGGQVQVRGRRGHRPWRVGIQHPRRPDYFAFLELTSGSISTSGDYENFFIDEDRRRWHHIIDLETGLPVEGTLSTTLVTPTGLYGDALSTACFVVGGEKCLAMLARIPAEAEAVVIDSQFGFFATPGTRDKLHFNIELEGDRLPR